MPQPYSPAAPDKQTVRLRIMDEHVELTRWTQYHFAGHFLTPSDGWSCTVSDGNLDAKQKNALRLGARVRLYIDDSPLAEGFIDDIEIDADRRGGVQYQIMGRDRLGAAVDAVADPRTSFADGVTLADFLKQIFSPFGWVADESFDISNDANRSAKTGGVRGTPTTHGGKKKGPQPLKSFVLHQLKPHDHEGLFRFASRVAERFGLWIWPSADGEVLIVGKPDFDQDPRYQLRRRNDGSSGHDGGTNIESGKVKYSSADQPSVIIADGFSGGGEFGRGQFKSFCVNPYFGVDQDGFIADDVQEILNHYPEAQPVLFVTQPFSRRAQRMPPRPAFLHDEESKTQDQLNFFVKRTMSELLRKSLVCHYTVEGHGQTGPDGGFTPWDVDTTVDVQDEVGMVSERMYVLGRSFEKARGGGTFTHLELVRLYSIASGDQEALAAAKPVLLKNESDGKPRQFDLVEQNASLDTAAPRTTKGGSIFTRGGG